jgi:Cullin family
VSLSAAGDFLNAKSALEVYIQQFEVPFINATVRYYEKESRQYLDHNDVTEYMKWVERRLGDEKGRVAPCLHERTMGPLMSACERVLIEQHLPTLRGAYSELLSNGFQDDLDRMRKLCARIRGGDDFLDQPKSPQQPPLPEHSHNTEGIQAGPVSDQGHLSGTNDNVEGRQSAQTHIQAGPPTDSGYASAMHGKSEHEPNLGVEDHRHKTEEVQSGLSTDDAYVSAANELSDCEQDLNDLESDDIRTIYSDASSLPLQKMEAYIAELADDLFSKVRFLLSDVETMESISRALPELLKAFALRVGYNAPTQMHRDVMFFVHKNRR